MIYAEKHASAAPTWTQSMQQMTEPASASQSQRISTPAMLVKKKPIYIYNPIYHWSDFIFYKITLFHQPLIDIINMQGRDKRTYTTLIQVS